MNSAGEELIRNMERFGRKEKSNNLIFVPLSDSGIAAPV